MFDPWRGFTESSLTEQWQGKLKEAARQARGQILKMTTVAASGHPGGSMSSVDVLLTLYHMAKVDPNKPKQDDRDRIIISHGHVSPAAYAGLASAGFFDIYPALHGFRQGGSPFAGHVERCVPGVEWDTGNLGQGLSVGVGKALYARLSGQDFHTFVMMGDGEQQKGQLGEARRLARKYKLSRLTAIVDFNRLQISGKTDDVMPQDIRMNWEADGWKVVEIDAHDFNQIYAALREAYMASGAPIMILANSVMGKGVSFMENDEGYHGAPVKPDMIGKALAELGVEDDIEDLKARRAKTVPPPFPSDPKTAPKIRPGKPLTYAVEEKLDNRGSWGKALMSVAEQNMGRKDLAVAVFDNDLGGSVKVSAFGKEYPENFFQCGISEHNTAVVAGALSAEKALSVWAAFGAFGVDETYNQARLNDINHTNMKLFCTHSGIDVGEDGKTHQCIDYFGVLNSTFGWKVITPADPNQTDRIARYALSTPGNFAVIMGRSKMNMIAGEDGKPYFGGEYEYRYGRMETVRTGQDVALVCSGNILRNGFGAWEILKENGINISLVSVSDWSDLHADDLAMLGGFKHVVTLEDHNVKNGLGSAIASSMMEAGLATKFTRLGVTEYGGSGKPAELYKILGLDAESVADRINEIVKETENIGV